MMSVFLSKSKKLPVYCFRCGAKLVRKKERDRDLETYDEYTGELEEIWIEVLKCPKYKEDKDECHAFYELE